MRSMTKAKWYIYTLLIIIAITILMSYQVAYIGLLLGFHLGPVEGTLLILGIFYLLVLLGPWLREYVSGEALFFVATFIIIPFAFSSYFMPWVFMNQFMGARLLQPAIYNEYLPSIWAPPPSVLQPALAGGVPVPWSEWIRPIAFWYIFLLSSVTMAIALASIVKERWNKIEMLAYPHAVVIDTVVGYTTGEKKSASWLFHTGIAVGFLIYLPWILHLLLPGFPNIYGWNRPPFRYGRPTMLDLVVFSPVIKQNYAGVFSIETSPVNVAFYYLVPLDVLFTAWISWLIFLILIPQIAYTLGYYPNMPALADSIARYDLIGRTDPLKIHAFAGVGLFIGVFIWPVLLNWKWYLNTIKKAIKSTPIKELKEGEVGYSFSYTLLTASFLVLAVLMVISGAHIVEACWLFIAVIIHNLVMARQLAEAGVAFSGGWWGTLQALTYHVLYRGYTLDKFNTSYYSVQLMAHSLICASASSISYGPTYYSLLAYKLGEEHGMKSATIFKNLFFSAAISIAIAIPLVVWSWYTIGYSKIPSSVDGWWWPDRWTNPSLISPYPADEPWWLHVLGGLALSGAIFYLKIRYYWFPISGIGLLFGTIGGAWGVAFSAFIAWLFKYITLKFGGAKVYENYGVPLATGLFLGYIFSVFVLGLGQIYKFLFPY